MVIIVGYGDETRNLMVKYSRMACECVSRNVRFTWNIRASNERENRKVLIFLVVVGPQGFLENYRELKPNRSTLCLSGNEMFNTKSCCCPINNGFLFLGWIVPLGVDSLERKKGRAPDPV